MSQKINGKSYKTSNGVTFKILETEAYSKSKVSPQYKQILDYKSGLLVAISYRASLIPNVTTENGVSRLRKVEIDGRVIDRPNAISTALGITEGMKSYGMSEVK